MQMQWIQHAGLFPVRERVPFKDVQNIPAHVDYALTCQMRVFRRCNTVFRSLDWLLVD